MGAILIALLWLVDIPLWFQIVGTILLAMRYVLSFCCGMFKLNDAASEYYNSIEGD